MKTKNVLYNRLILFTLGLSFCLLSCKKSSDNDTSDPVQDSDAFAIVGEVTNPSALYFMTAGDLTSGSVTAIGRERR